MWVESYDNGLPMFQAKVVIWGRAENTRTFVLAWRIVNSLCESSCELCSASIPSGTRLLKGIVCGACHKERTASEGGSQVVPGAAFSLLGDLVGIGIVLPA